MTTLCHGLPMPAAMPSCLKTLQAQVSTVNHEMPAHTPCVQLPVAIVAAAWAYSATLPGLRLAGLPAVTPSAAPAAAGEQQGVPPWCLGWAHGLPTLSGQPGGQCLAATLPTPSEFTNQVRQGYPRRCRGLRLDKKGGEGKRGWGRGISLATVCACTSLPALTLWHAMMSNPACN